MLVAKSGCLFLVKLQPFMINGNDRVCDELCGTVFSLRLLWSLFIVKLQASSINIKLLLLMAATESLPESVFGEASGLH